MSDWQKIDTAPVDTEMLVASDSGVVFIGVLIENYYVGYRVCEVRSGDTVKGAKYWMPLPAAPPQEDQ